MATDFSNIRFPKDVRIDDIVIIPHSQEPVSVYDIFSELNLYEDIYSNTLSGEIILSDALNLPSNLPLTGHEKIFFSFYTPEKEDKKIELIMNVYKISDRVFLTDKKQSYTLYFTSSETIKDKVLKISESFSGTHDKIIKKIFDKFQSNKSIEVEETRYQTKFIIPRWNPFKAINWISQRCISNENGNANLMFFETADGFKFKSFTSMIQDGKENVSDTYIFRPHKFSTESGLKSLKEDAKSIESYNVRSNFDIIKRLHNGMFASRILIHDIRTKEFKDFTFDYKKNFDSTQKLEDGPFVPNSPNLDDFKYNEAFDSNIHIIPDHSFMYDDIEDVKHYKEWLLQRQSEIQQYDNIIVDITISGDSARRVGQVVKLILPSQEPFSDVFVEDPMLSGKYIITSIRHKVKRDNYVSILELTKDTFLSGIKE